MSIVTSKTIEINPYPEEKTPATAHKETKLYDRDDEDEPPT
jgi:hypothetical protein